MNDALVIRRRISFEEVPWGGVLDKLTKRLSLPFDQAYSDLNRFLKHFKSPVDLYWYEMRKLSDADNRIAASICECLGADVVVVTLEKHLSTPLLNISYKQELELEPRFSRAGLGKGICKPVIFLHIGKYDATLDTVSKVIFFYGIIFFLAVVSYVVLIGLLLYGIAIFILFLSAPLDVTIAATKKPSLGLGLLAFFVAGAALFGKAARNVAALALKQLRSNPSEKKD